MPDGGRLLIASTCVNVDSVPADDTRRTASTFVRVAISDTGSGIDPTVLQHVFEPFFTTKAKGMGSGLGLAVSRQIIEKHAGCIDVRNNPEKGCTFRFFFPAAS